MIANKNDTSKIKKTSKDMPKSSNTQKGKSLASKSKAAKSTSAKSKLNRSVTSNASVNKCANDELQVDKPIVDKAEIDQLYTVARWWNTIKSTNNETFLPLFADEHRFLVLMGGGGSGKSIFAGRKILERAISEPGHRFLVCRKVAKTIRESCFKQLLGQLSEHYPNANYRANKSDFAIIFNNGSEIIFAGLDDVEKLKSIYNITGIWIEEASELMEGDFNQLNIRLRGKTTYYKQIILSFNPVNILHWLKKRFFDYSDPRAKIHHSTYKDNRFLDTDAIATLEAFRDVDEYYYQVYCLGMWGVLGKSVFDSAAIARRMSSLPPPVKKGYFAYDYDGKALSNIHWIEATDGFIKIFKEPEVGCPYVIGCDTAGEGSDQFVAQVIDNITTSQVAIIRRQFDEDVFAKQIYCLGLYYNTALVGIEANYSTYPIAEMERLKYPRQYVRQKLDDFTHAAVNAYGFVTSSKTRPVIIAELVRAVREDIQIVSDDDTLSEMLTFVRNEHFRAEAEAGAHDDCVMALAIAHYIRPQQKMYVEEGEAAEHKWTRDMWEDYNNASPVMREEIIKKWGRPS